MRQAGSVFDVNRWMEAAVECFGKPDGGNSCGPYCGSRSGSRDFSRPLDFCGKGGCAI